MYQCLNEKWRERKKYTSIFRHKRCNLFHTLLHQNTTSLKLIQCLVVEMLLRCHSFILPVIITRGMLVIHRKSHSRKCRTEIIYRTRKGYQRHRHIQGRYAKYIMIRLEATSFLRRKPKGRKSKEGNGRTLKNRRDQKSHPLMLAHISQNLPTHPFDPTQFGQCWVEVHKGGLGGVSYSVRTRLIPPW